MTAPSRTSALETVLHYHRAWTRGDIDRAMSLVAENAVTTTTAPAAECFTVEDGVIVENLLVFDRLSFAPPPES